MQQIIAYIDGQNLYLGTTSQGRQVDFLKFRTYLKDKFSVTEAYYYLGFISEEQQDLYNQLQKAGFIVIFREHSATLKGKKKGNVDSDIIFDIMKRIYEKKDIDGIVLISGDGDYIKLVKHLITKGLLKKVLFPNNNYSSLYKPIKDTHAMNLGTKEIKEKIALQKKPS